MNKSNKYFMLLDDDITFYKNSFKNMNSALKSNKIKELLVLHFAKSMNLREVF